jgi:hypothetical protein
MSNNPQSGVKMPQLEKRTLPACAETAVGLR